MTGSSQIIEAIVEDFRTYVGASAHYVVMGGHQAEQKKYDGIAQYLDGLSSPSDILPELKSGSRSRLRQIEKIKEALGKLGEDEMKRVQFLQIILSATDSDLVEALREAKPQLAPLQERLRGRQV